MDKASNFSILNEQVKGTSKTLTFFNFLVRVPISDQEAPIQINEPVDLNATVADLDANLEGSESFNSICYLYFYSNPKDLDTSDVVVQLQADLRAKLALKYPDYEITWISFQFF